MSSDLRANLLQLGFNLRQARAAVDAGNQTIEAATEWIFENSDRIEPSQTGAALRLRDEDDEIFDADLQQALAESKLQQASASSDNTPSDDTKAAASSASKKIKINIIRNQTPAQITPPLPLTSRHKEEEAQATNAARLSEANKRAEQAKKAKQEARLAHQRALNDLKEDRENRKLRSNNVPISSSGNTPTSAATSQNINTSRLLPQISVNNNTPSTTAKSQTMVQLRLKNGTVVKRSFENNATIKDLFELVRSEGGDTGSADISLIQPFPRREYTIGDRDLTLLDAGLCPSCSLNVFVQMPIPAPQPIAPPNTWLPNDIEMEEPPTQDDLNGDEDSNGYEGDGGQGNMETENDSEDNEGNEGSDDHQVGNGDDGDHDEEDDMMYALPMPHQPPHDNHQNPVAGRGRGRGRGRGLPFSGVGHALGSASSSSATDQSQSSTMGRNQAPTEDIPTETDAVRRQRILDAMANRIVNRAGENDKSPSVPQKKAKKRDIPSLQAICCHEVALLVIAGNAASTRHLKLLKENVGPQAAEGIVHELTKLKQLDQLTLKRLHRCSIQSMVLDSYSRATDSLMDTIGNSQARSLTYLSMKECTFLTDSGFANITRLEELEYLDLSHCRVTDKTLGFTLNLPNLTTLLLSGTKITSNGLARIISEAAWKSTLHTLDVSFCQGIGLTNLSTLKLNNTAAFGSAPIKVPDDGAFACLLKLDLARTQITDNDLMKLTPVFMAVQVLNLSACPNIGANSLEFCVTALHKLQNISFPNREHDLLTVLPAAAALPLTHLDLTGFLYVTDDAILTLASAVNLQLLSLAGTKLTNVGAAVLVHMTSLKELLLDRTSVGDKAMDYLRDLGRLEELSLNRCEKLTVAGIIKLSKSAFFSMKLKRLNLGFNKYIHDEALAVFTQCHELHTLNLEYTDVTEERALLLQNSLPNLEQLRIQGVTNGSVLEETPHPVLN
ncbi:hypothetical protein BX616_003862 [Lobosporangium transversale]|nr:hypothetical protein BX616_003862 [Lobosporangium transversale]